MTRADQSRCSGGRRSQRGFTLIETLVSLAILTVIGGVIAATYSVGLKALGAGGAEDRLAGAHDQEVFEQLLGKDAARAACIQVSGGTKYGSCSAGLAHATITTACSSAVVCIGWPQVSESSCHVAVYRVTSGVARRQEYRVAANETVTPYANNLITTDTVSLLISVTTTSAPSGGAWVGSLTIAITNTGVAKGVPTDTLVLHPLASDPAGPAAAITGSGPPC